MLLDLNNQSSNANEYTQNEFANTINMQVDENSLLHDFIKNKDKNHGEENEQFLKMQVEIILNQNDDDPDQFPHGEEGQESYRKQLDSHNLIGEEIRRYNVSQEPHSGSVISQPKNPWTYPTGSEEMPPRDGEEQPQASLGAPKAGLGSLGKSGLGDQGKETTLDSPTGWPGFAKKGEFDPENFESELEEPLLENGFEEPDLEAEELRTAKEETDGSEWKSALEFNFSNRMTNLNKSRLQPSQEVHAEIAQDPETFFEDPKASDDTNLFQSIIFEPEPNPASSSLKPEQQKSSQFYSTVEFKSEILTSQPGLSQDQEAPQDFAKSEEFVDLTNINESNPLDKPDPLQPHDSLPQPIPVPAADDEDLFFSVGEGSTVQLSNLDV